MHSIEVMDTRHSAYRLPLDRVGLPPMPDRTELDEFNWARQQMQQRMNAGRHCGLSSDALTRWAYGTGPEPLVPGTPTSAASLSFEGSECGSDYPHDTSDLDACRRTVELAVTLGLRGDIIARMQSKYAEFAGWVLRGVNRHGAVVTAQSNDAIDRHLAALDRLYRSEPSEPAAPAATVQCPGQITML